MNDVFDLKMESFHLQAFIIIYVASNSLYFLA